jgi:hypothetical protein
MTHTVFVLEHIHELSPGSDDVKLIGIFSTRALLTAALATTGSLPGFAENAPGFRTTTFSLGEEPTGTVFSVYAVKDATTADEAGALLGVYATHSLAAEAVEEFRSNYDEAEYEFQIYPEELDTSDWQEGFTTIEPE